MTITNEWLTANREAVEAGLCCPLDGPSHERLARISIPAAEAVRDAYIGEAWLTPATFTRAILNFAGVPLGQCGVTGCCG